jgi:hypothetical protein
MPPNWLVQWSPIIENAATAVAVLGGAGIALAGLNTWKKQLRGQTDYDLARRLMKAVYKVRNEIQEVRSPWIMGSETEKAVKTMGLEGFDKDNEQKQMGAVYELRYQRVAACWVELETAVLEAEATWGSEWTGVIKDLEACVRELRSAFRLFVLEYERPGSSPEKQKEISDIINSRRDKSKDKFAQEIDAAVRKFEDVARPHLGQPRKSLIKRARMLLRRQ